MNCKKSRLCVNLSFRPQGIQFLFRWYNQDPKWNSIIFVRDFASVLNQTYRETFGGCLNPWNLFFVTSNPLTSNARKIRSKDAHHIIATRFGRTQIHHNPNLNDKLHKLFKTLQILIILIYDYHGLIREKKDIARTSIIVKRITGDTMWPWRHEQHEYQMAQLKISVLTKDLPAFGLAKITFCQCEIFGLRIAFPVPWTPDEYVLNNDLNAHLVEITYGYQLYIRMML